MNDEAITNPKLNTLTGFRTENIGAPDENTRALVVQFDGGGISITVSKGDQIPRVVQQFELVAAHLRAIYLGEKQFSDQPATLAPHETTLEELKRRITYCVRQLAAARCVMSVAQLQDEVQRVLTQAELCAHDVEFLIAGMKR
jgi:hypothetical protein